MHRTLKIPELVLEIADLLRNPHLFHFALTCRAIWTFVQPNLWRHVEFPALRSLLPMEVDNRGEDTVGRIRWRFLRASDCERLLECAPRIRCLVQDFRGPPDDVILALRAVTPYYSPELIFAKLRDLSLIFGYAEEIRAFIPFTVLDLRRLSVRFANRSPSANHFYVAVEELLCRIGAGHHGIRQICIKIYDRTVCEPLTQSVNDMIARMPYLEEAVLRVASDGHVLLHRLAGLAFLKKLDIHVCSNSGVFDRYRLPSNPFRSLNALYIRSHDCRHGQPHLADLLRDLSTTSLSRLLIVCDDFPSLKDILRIIGERWPNTFTSLDLTIREQEWRYGLDVPLCTFVPLHPCAGLQELRITPHAPLNLNDRHYDMMSEAWPGLRVLEVREDSLGYWAEPQINGERIWIPKNTRRSLAILAARCHALERLYVTADFNAPCEESVDGQVPPGSHGLRKLSFPPSANVSSDYAACAFLCTIFPRLRAEVITFETWDDEESEVDMSWEDEEGEWFEEMEEVDDDGEGEFSD